MSEHKINEQWVENGRMYKAVKEQGEECVGCCHDIPTGGCTAPSMQGGKYECPVDRGLMVIDLGPVNDDGCLAEERTLRDWFAGQALFGLMAMFPLSDVQVAKRAYQYADAMLKERNKMNKELLEALKETSEALEFALGRLGCCGNGDGKDHKADADDYGGMALLDKNMELIKKYNIPITPNLTSAQENAYNGSPRDSIGEKV